MTHGATHEKSCDTEPLSEDGMCLIPPAQNVHLSYLCRHIMSSELHCCGAMNALRGMLCTNTSLVVVSPVGPSQCLYLFLPRLLPYQNAWNLTGPASLSGPLHCCKVQHVTWTSFEARTCWSVNPR